MLKAPGIDFLCQFHPIIIVESKIDFLAVHCHMVPWGVYSIGPVAVKPPCEMIFSSREKDFLRTYFDTFHLKLNAIDSKHELFNSYGTDRLYPPRDHMAVNCQKVNFGFYNG